MLEHIPITIYDDYENASLAVAQRIAALVRQHNDEGRPTVLGLATGHTPIEVYRQLIRMHCQEGLDFSRVITFNLDEYWPMAPDALQSYRRWMFENFFKHVNIVPENIHIPDGTMSEEELPDYCQSYEQAIVDAGGIDLQILGIGRTGHVGFNEPGSRRTSTTRLVSLDRVTRMDAASDFFSEEHVPHQAITMGIETIMSARSVCLLAFGEQKAAILRRTIEEPLSPQIAASFLQEHPDATFYLNRAAAASLTRMATPWLISRCEWDDSLTRRAVIWLSRKLDKAVLTLTDHDYAENHLYGLLTARGNARNLNREIFNHMMNTMTEWPAGENPGKKILVFSPHPDDDVISMGATLTRLKRQGHDVHIAYQTDGSIAVFDHAVRREADFVSGFNTVFGLDPKETGRIDRHIEELLRQKEPAGVDSSEVQAVKALIRKTEAIAAASYCGVARENCYFLEMPFYQTGTVQKLPISDQDISLILELLRSLRPEIIFAAGDLSDPHGTHRMCLEAVFSAMRRFVTECESQPAVWLYRGAWQEWEPYQIDMVVPVSPDELYHKRHAIFRHESQKDRAMFPGPYDTREFWQRAESRNRETASIYDKLGLPEYYAMEAFVCWPNNP